MMEQSIKLHEKRGYLWRKRAVDIVLALLACIMLTPVFVLIACAMKIECWQSPILFRQVRIGLGGKPFTMYKFRSMVDGAEALKETLRQRNEVSGPVFKMKQDPRITRVGRFIRHTSLDELPQLVNVLRGEMSFVGPRPALPEEVACYSSYEQQRLLVMPGLTCYWQISGRNTLSFEEWVTLDLKYIEDRSLWLDLKLIVKTTRVFFGSNDAY